MSGTNGWDKYINDIINRWSHKQEKYTVNNSCLHAAIIGLDGTQWAASADWPGLKTYDHDLDDGFGTIEKVNVDELKCAIGASEGNRNPSAAGVSVAGIKFVLNKHEPAEGTSAASAYLIKMGGGGACICKTKQAIVIGIWGKDLPMSNGQT